VRPLIAELTIAIKKLGKSFIKGFIGLMTNEKDPHNLMLAFSILKVILVEFDIVGLQEVHLNLSGLNIRNFSMQCFVTFQSPLKHDQMISTA
jgi:Dos2-interacting transcription regulator of RNA-Pol-II